MSSTPLIPREHLFGNPTETSGMISPDGKWLSWLAPNNGVMNVWMAPVSAPDDGKVMTDATDRPIQQYFWAGDSARPALYSGQGWGRKLTCSTVSILRAAKNAC